MKCKNIIVNKRVVATQNESKQIDIKLEETEVFRVN